MTHGVGTYSINSFWESGSLIFYEKAVGHTATGNVFQIGASSVQVGDTANDVDYKWYGTTTGTFILDAAAHTLAMTGMATSTNGALTVSLTTDASSLTAGALIVAGGIACAKKLFVGDDIDMSVSGTGVYDLVLKTNIADALSIKDSAADIIVFETTTGAPKVTITPATTITGAVILNGALQVSNTILVGVDDTGYDAKFFGATTGCSALWDESEDQLVITGPADVPGLKLAGAGSKSAAAYAAYGAAWADAATPAFIADQAYLIVDYAGTLYRLPLWANA